MAITLITGQPGHGKTQWAIGEGMRLAKTGRTVYAGNIRGLNYEAAGFQKLESFEQWQSLPDGSVVLWDECYDALAQRGAGKKIPDHVEALARHRHRGFDFLLVCQQTKQLDSFISGLIERHLHCRRRFGTSFVRIKEWDKWERDCDKSTPLATHLWRLQPKIWALYESATVHTVKRRIPWYIWALPVLIAAVVAMYYAIPARMMARADASMPADGRDGAAAPARTSSRATPGTEEDMRRQDPEAALRPRLDGQPWSAPAYDGVKFAPPPRLACMSSADSCTCVTVGYGTVYGASDYTCRLIARLGYYDPTYDPSRERMAAAPPPDRTERRAAPAEPVTGGATNAWRPIPIIGAYTQPQATTASPVTSNM